MLVDGVYAGNAGEITNPSEPAHALGGNVILFEFMEDSAIATVSKAVVRFFTFFYLWFIWFFNQSNIANILQVSKFVRWEWRPFCRWYYSIPPFIYSI